MSKTTNGDLYLLDSSVEDQVSMLPLDKDMISISFALNIKPFNKFNNRTNTRVQHTFESMLITQFFLLNFQKQVDKSNNWTNTHLTYIQVHVDNTLFSF